MNILNILKRKKIKTLIMFLLLTISIVLILSSPVTRGWFSSGNRKIADSEAIEIDEPPILYILDSDAEDITQLSLTGLEIGVPKKIVFCISSVYPLNNSVNSTKTSFDIELVYTNNLGAMFNLYAADITQTAGANTINYQSQRYSNSYFAIGEELTWDNVSNNGNQSAYTNNNYNTDDVQQYNRAVYKKYLASSSPASPNYNMRFIQNGTQINSLYDKTKCRYFVLDITWNTDSLDKKALEKEIDMVYIIARGGQIDE